MDPASAIIGVASGAAGLVAITGKVVTYLINLRDSHRNAELIVLDLVSTCQACETAWSRIRQWALEAHALKAENSESILRQLETFLEAGKVIMDLIDADLDRLSWKSKRSGWWRAGGRPTGRATTQLLLHEKAVLDHADRIHRQNTSLNLLLSVLTLPSTPLQEAAVEILRPRFRKDEETAWTIVNSKYSPGSRAWPTTLASSRRSSIGSMMSVFSHKNHSNSKFTFEDELFLGPVYKRLLITKLCEQPWSHSRSESRSCVPTTRPEPTQASSAPDQDQSAYHDEDALALELRQQGTFSRSCHEDYLEFMDRHRPRKMQRRHLPLVSVLCQRDRGSQEQERIDQSFFDAVEQRV